MLVKGPRFIASCGGKAKAWGLMCELGIMLRPAWRKICILTMQQMQKLSACVKWECGGGLERKQLSQSGAKESFSRASMCCPYARLSHLFSTSYIITCHQLCVSNSPLIQLPMAMKWWMRQDSLLLPNEACSSLPPPPTMSCSQLLPPYPINSLQWCIFFAIPHQHASLQQVFFTVRLLPQMLNCDVLIYIIELHCTAHHYMLLLQFQWCPPMLCMDAQTSVIFKQRFGVAASKLCFVICPCIQESAPLLSLLLQKACWKKHLS